MSGLTALPPIRIETITAEQQRYATAGDWYYDGDTLVIRVSDTGNPDSNFLVALHELVEQYLAQRRGITPQMVDESDNGFDKLPQDVRDQYDDDPGDHPKSIIHREHMLAKNIERLVAYDLGVDWVTHEDRLEAVYRRSKKACPRKPR